MEFEENHLINNKELEGGAIGGARKKMYKLKNCSPGESNVVGSCLNDDIIIKVSTAINKMSKKNC